MGTADLTRPVLTLTVVSTSGEQKIDFVVDRLMAGGWAGRDMAEVQAHVKELQKHNVPAPVYIPCYMNLSTYLVTLDDGIEVASDQSSAEVEFILFIKGDGMWVGVGSDHTDRAVESLSIPGAKQTCAKVIAPKVWPYEAVRDHWDQLILRCWVTKDGKRELYQEGQLEVLIDAQTLLEKMPHEMKDRMKGSVVLLSGTMPTRAGLVYGDYWEIEMEDPILKRNLKHEYAVTVLPQFV
ncbi:MAG: DUF2848 family protein [Candidatus Tectomicrobia bacterium]|nr:DUF2848 family protein [Candidatus Tectomicrobia bacterium]